MQVMLLLLDRLVLFQTWITTNKSRGTGPADGSASAAATDAATGNRRGINQALLKGVLQSMFTNGANLKWL